MKNAKLCPEFRKPVALKAENIGSRMCCVAVLLSLHTLCLNGRWWRTSLVASEELEQTEVLTVPLAICYRVKRFSHWRQHLSSSHVLFLLSGCEQAKRNRNLWKSWHDYHIGSSRLFFGGQTWLLQKLAWHKWWVNLSSVKRNWTNTDVLIFVISKVLNLKMKSMWLRIDCQIRQSHDQALLTSVSQSDEMIPSLIVSSIYSLLYLSVWCIQTSVCLSPFLPALDWTAGV